MLPACAARLVMTDLPMQADFSNGLAGWTSDASSQCQGGDCAASVMDGHYSAFVDAGNNYSNPDSFVNLSQSLPTCIGKTYKVTVTVTFE